MEKQRRRKVILIRRNNRRTEIDALTSGVMVPESSSLTVLCPRSHLQLLGVST